MLKIMNEQHGVSLQSHNPVLPQSVLAGLAAGANDSCHLEPQPCVGCGWWLLFVLYTSVQKLCTVTSSFSFLFYLLHVGALLATSCFRDQLLLQMNQPTVS